MQLTLVHMHMCMSVTAILALHARGRIVRKSQYANGLLYSPLLGGCYVYDGCVNLLHTQVGVNCGYIRCELWLYSGVNC